MNFTKKSRILLAAVLGVCLLTTAAFADMVIGSGYGEFKNAVKKTSKVLADNATKSYSVHTNFIVSVDGKTLTADEGLTKKDFEHNRSYYEAKHLRDGTESEEMNYQDENMYAFTQYEGGNEPKLYVTYYDVPHENFSRETDFFENELAADFEKLADAVMGGMKDVVQTEKSNGYTIYSGSVDSTQIPLYLNVLASIGIKYAYIQPDQLGNLEEFRQDVFVTSVSAKFTADEQNVLCDGLANVEFIGSDRLGNRHTGMISVAFTIADINQTTVDVPDVSNAEVLTSGGDEDGFDWETILGIDIGKYQNKCYEIEDGRRVKTEETTLWITDVNETEFFGEIEIKERDSVVRRISFTGNTLINHDACGFVFGYIENGEQKQGVLQRYTATSFGLFTDYVNTEDGEALPLSSAKDMQWVEE